MKKVFAALLIFFTLVFSAFAANLDGNAETSAAALKKLNLFLGTDKGFELERPMTRAEAAAMLVRFLGAEKKALEGSYAHPFIDVPQWADGYVGWLYVSGLTKGVSTTRYGSQQAVTAWQYATFLTRALKEDESIPQSLITEEEISAIDKHHAFLRGDAAILSIRALGCYYTKNQNYRPLADVCIERKLFTAAEFSDACFDFFAPSYTFDDTGIITLRILGIPIRQTQDGGYFTNESIDPIASDGTRYDPFVYKVKDGTVTICSMDPHTLETTELARREGISGHYNYRNLFKLGETHYIFETLADVNKNTLFSVTDGEVQEVLTFTGGESVWYPSPGDNVYVDAGSVLIMTDRSYFCVTEDSYTEIDLKNLNAVAYLDGNILAQRMNETSVDILLLDAASGKEKACYTTHDDIDRGTYGEMARTVSRERDSYYYGEAGLYFYQNGTLTQISARPANDFFKLDDGSFVILTHELGVRYSGQDAFGGNQVMQLHPNGEEKLLTPEAMDVAPIDSIFLKDGNVHFVTATGVGMMNFDTYTYRIEADGKITVTDFSAGYPEMTDGFTWENPDGYKERYIKKEQDRIDALGY